LSVSSTVRTHEGMGLAPVLAARNIIPMQRVTHRNTPTRSPRPRLRPRLIIRPHGCPCGYLTDPRRDCHCTPPAIQRYLSRVSGPLLDRIDIHVDVPPVGFRDLRGPDSGPASADIRKQVQTARQIQAQRFSGFSFAVNARMGERHLKQYCQLASDCEQVLAQAMTGLGLSARAHARILKVARTIADLENAHDIQIHHISEAVQYRTLDRELWR